MVQHARLLRASRILPVLALLLLTACVSLGSQPVPPGSTPTIAAAPTMPAGSGVAGAATLDLPGRLLWVQNGTIWLWEGAQARPLLGGGEAWQPAWSPDGTRFAYVARGESYSDIWLASAAGEPMTQLTSNESRFPLRSHERIYDSVWAFYPTWSPDGASLALAGQFGPPIGAPAFEYNLILYRLPVAGGNQIPIYADEEAHIGRMAYRPDGRALVYTSSSATSGGPQQLYRLVLANGEARGEAAPYPGAPERSYDPAFSPDGRWLVFAARDGNETNIWFLPSNAAAASSPNPQRLTSIGTARAPTFSPDGRLLAFLAIPPDEQGFELWVAEVSLRDDGILQAGEPRQLTTAMRLDPDSGISWAP